MRSNREKMIRVLPAIDFLPPSMSNVDVGTSSVRVMLLQISDSHGLLITNMIVDATQESQIQASNKVNVD